MAERSLELRAAIARRQYWQEQVELARRAGDTEALARALQYVAEYEDFIGEIERELRPEGRRLTRRA